MGLTLAAIEAERLTLETIEAELELIRLQCRGFSAVGRVTMRDARPATPAELLDLRRAIARYEHLLRAADQILRTLADPPNPN